MKLNIEMAMKQFDASASLKQIKVDQKGTQPNYRLYQNIHRQQSMKPWDMVDARKLHELAPKSKVGERVGEQRSI